MEIADITQSIAGVFKSDNVEAKRKMLSSLGSNLTWDSEELNIHNDIAIEKLIEGIKRAKSINPEFEPRNYVVNKGSKEKTEPKDPVFSIMLPGQDSNLRPIDYTYPYVSVGVDYIIILFLELGCEALRAAFAGLLSCEIVSEPSMEINSKAWLLIALVTNVICTLGFPAIHLIFNIDFSIRLLFRTKSNVTVDCSTAELPRNVFLLAFRVRCILQFFYVFTIDSMVYSKYVCQRLNKKNERMLIALNT